MEIIDCIIKRISDSFKDYEIYSAKINQGFLDKCFIVLEESGDLSKVQQNRYMKNRCFNIYCYSKDDFSLVFDKVCRSISNLSEICVRSSLIRYVIEKDVMKITAFYKYYVFESNNDCTNMKKIEIKI